nr:uncharacterized protein LOC109163674 [Ipomoea batatas]
MGTKKDRVVSPVGFLNSCAEEMKKGFDGFNKSQAGSGETKADFKHRTLLDEFLELQKIFEEKTSVFIEVPIL